MQIGGSMDRRLRISGILVVAGLLVEGLCLMWARPIAFIVFVSVGGALMGLGVLLFLYSLVSAAPHPAGSSGSTRDRD